MKLFQRLFALSLIVVAFAGCESVPNNPQSTGISPSAQLILQRWIDSQGGAAALLANRNYIVTSTVDYGNGAPPVKSTVWRAESGSFRHELLNPNGMKIIRGFDGTHAWVYNEVLGFGEMPMAEALQSKIRGDSAEALNVAKNYRYCRLGTERVIDGNTYVTLELQGSTGLREWWYFDPVTARRMRAEYDNGPDHPVIVTEYSNFKTISGVTLPFGGTTIVNDRKSKVTLESIEFNPSLDDVEFSPSEQQIRDAATIAQMLERQVESLGGRAAYDQIESRVMHTTISVNNKQTQTVITQKRPNKILVETDMPGIGTILQGYDGKTGWASSAMQGYRELKGPELQQLVNNVDLSTEVQLAQRFNLRKLIGEKTIGDRPALGISLASWQGVAGIYYFDLEDAMIRRIETTLITGAKGLLPVTVDFDDYRKVDGITIAFKTTTTNPAMTMVTTIESVETNVPVDDAIFAPQEM